MSSRSRTALLGIATVLVLAGSAAFVGGFNFAPEGSDLELFSRYARLALDGSIPYRDFFLEYPPGALLAMLPPGLGNPSLDAYSMRFAGLVVVLLGFTALACAAVLSTTAATREQFIRTLALVALSPLLVGPLVLKRFDILPALLTVLALLLVVRRNFVPSAFALGLGTAVKLYPIVLLPIVVAAALGRSRRDAFMTALSFLAGCALLFVPFLLLSPGGIGSSLHSQLGRHLQLESSLASLAFLAHLAAGVNLGLIPEAHSYALGGMRGTLLGLMTTLVFVLGLLLVWWRAPRVARSGDGLILLFAATIAVTVAFGRVLSPQFLLWLLPLVPLVRGGSGRLATGLLATACILTNIWFPKHFVEVIRTLDGGSILLLATRNALLVALAATLVVAVWRVPQRHMR